MITSNPNISSQSGSNDQQMEISNEDLSHQQQNTNKILLRENLAEHMESNSNYHLSLIHFYYNREINAMKLRLESLSTTICEPTSPTLVKQHASLASTLNQDENTDDSRFQFVNTIDASKKFTDASSERLVCEIFIFFSFFP
jgi:hypothetical protein